MQYLYDLNDEKNFIDPVEVKRPDGYVFENQHTVLLPENPRRNLTMTDSVMFKSQSQEAPKNMHVHHGGYEIFFVDSGGMDSYVNQQKAYVKPGSILFYQPFQAHGAYFHADVKFRGFFHDLPYKEEGEAGVLLRKYYPDFATDPEFPPDNAPMRDFIDAEPAYNFKEVSPEECSCIRHRERPMAQFELDGCTAKMITARWENSGLCEMWCFEMKPGFFAESYKYPKITDLYYVTEGEVKFKVYDEEFVAKTEHLVKIPRYAPRRFEALTDAVMYDVGGMPMWHSYFLDRASILGLDPERAKDPETWDKLRNKYDIHYKL